MTIYYIDGFEKYPTSSGIEFRKIWYTDHSNSPRIFFDNGIRSSKSLRMDYVANFPNYIIYNYNEILDFPLSGIIGFWYKTTSTYNSTSDYFFRIAVEPWWNPGSNFTLRGNTVLPLRVGIANVGTAMTNFTFTSNQWYHIEMQYQLRTTTTIPFILKVDGVKVIETGVGVNSIYSTGTYMVRPSFWLLNHSPTGESNWFDNLYIKDFEGGHNGFIGPHIYVTGTYPTGNGSVNQWTVSPPTGNSYDIINDRNYLADSYIRTSVSGNKELYNMTTLGDDVSQVLGVQYSVNYGQSGAYDARIKPLRRVGGVDYTDDFIDTMPAIPFQYNTKCFQPTGVWTKDTFNDAEFGFEFWTTGV